MAVVEGRPRRRRPAGPRIGAHLSIAGGVHRAVERAVRLRCRTFQIFTKNGNRWQGKDIPEADASAFRRRVREGRFEPVVAHDSYLINVASPDDALRRRSIEALEDELVRANLLGLSYLVMHPGAHTGAGLETGLKRIAGALREVLARTPGDGTAILLETTAGQGTVIGSRFEELRFLIDALGGEPRLGVCLDTCHVFAAGYELRDEAGYRATMDAFDRVIGLDRLRVIHVNDTRKPFGSRVDRHHHIGHGEIGRDGFRRILTDDRLRDVPKILETPKGDDDEMDAKNLAMLRRLSRPVPIDKGRDPA